MPRACPFGGFGVATPVDALKASRSRPSARRKCHGKLGVAECL
jgi:hypothetical protein